VTFTLVAFIRSSRHNSPAAAPAASFKPTFHPTEFAYRLLTVGKNVGAVLRQSSATALAAIHKLATTCDNAHFPSILRLKFETLRTLIPGALVIVSKLTLFETPDQEHFRIFSVELLPTVRGEASWHS
jgi:hypothetical protein